VYEKIGFISDIHGNLEALEAVLKVLDEMKVRTIYCLGDIVGYGPDPSACLSLVRESCEVIIAGNHDWAVCGKTPIETFNPIARQAVIWTRKSLKDEELEFLSSLPLLFSIEKGILVHASPFQPEKWWYITTLWDASVAFSQFDLPLCFVGHTHVPLIFTLSGKKIIEKDYPLMVSENERYIINIGSVGQPRDHDPRGAFVVWEKGKGKIEIFRVGYNVKETQRKIIQKGLPVWLAERLALGW